MENAFFLKNKIDFKIIIFSMSEGINNILQAKNEEESLKKKKTKINIDKCESSMFLTKKWNYQFWRK